MDITPYLPYIYAFVAGIVLPVAHARGYKFPILESILDKLMGKTPVVPGPGPVTPPLPVSTGHPILDAVRNALANLGQPTAPKVETVQKDGLTQIVVTVPDDAAK